MSFPQPLLDKSLVNYDIRGARSTFIEKENKVLERAHKSPPIPEKQPSDYIVNTRFGPNPYVQRGMQPGYEVAMPQGQSPFLDLGGKKHFSGQPGEIKQQRSLENPFDLPNSYEFSMPYYPRSLNVRDIEGTNPGTLISKAVIKQSQAQKLIEQEKAQQDASEHNQPDPYEAYQDALDKFKSEINGGGGASSSTSAHGNNFKDRHQIQARGNLSENPYAPVNDPRYNKNKMIQDADRWEDSIYEQPAKPSPSAQLEEQSQQRRQQQQYQQQANNYGSDSNGQGNSNNNYPPSQQQQQQSRDYSNNYGQQQQQEQQQYQQRQSQGYQPQRQYQQYTPPAQAPSGSQQNNNNTNNISQYARSYQPQIPPQDINNYSYLNSHYSSPQLLTQSQLQQQYNKVNPNNKLSQQSEIINHAMNNISPQITKQQLGPNLLNIEGYIGSRQDGTRINPTSMSYGAPSNHQNLIMHHSLLGNQIYSSPPDVYPTRLPHTRDGRITASYLHPNLNIEKFEKFAGELAAPGTQQGTAGAAGATMKAVTNSSIFAMPSRGVAPIGDLGNGMRNAATMRLPSEKNLEHYKRENPNRIPVFNDPRDDPNVRFQENNNSNNNNSNSLGSTMSKLAARPLPFGAPFSYNPNEFRKADMVSSNHQKLLEKIEHSIDVNDSNLVAIEHAAPEIQQPHIKKTLNQQPYDRFLQENDLVLQKELERTYGQKGAGFAGLGNNYGNGRSQSQQYPSEGYRYQQQQAEEFLAKHGPKALRNLSNVKIF